MPKSERLGLFRNSDLCRIIAPSNDLEDLVLAALLEMPLEFRVAIEMFDDRRLSPG